MLRVLSSKAQRKSSKPCYVGIHWRALAEYFQMSTHMPWFQSFKRFFGIRVKVGWGHQITHHNIPIGTELQQQHPGSSQYILYGLLAGIKTLVDMT